MNKNKTVQELFKAYSTLAESQIDNKHIEDVMLDIKNSILSLLETNDTPKTIIDRKGAPHKILSDLIKEHKIKKKELILLMGMSVSNTAYFNKYLDGTKPMSTKMAFKFIKAFKQLNIEISPKAMGLKYTY